MLMFENLRHKNFNILTLHHAAAILRHDLTGAVEEIEEVLSQITIPIEELVRGGGGEGQMTQRLRNSLGKRGWKKHKFEVKKVIDGKERESVSHEIDHVKKFPGGTFALEIEWNNKDPFYDRDLENFKRLHGDGAISVGGIITRGKSLHASLKDLLEEFALSRGISSIEQLAGYNYQPTTRQKQLIQNAVQRFGSFAKGWSHTFVNDKFGEATTHWEKLEERVQRGVGNPCPLLLIGIPKEAVLL